MIDKETPKRKEDAMDIPNSQTSTQNQTDVKEDIEQNEKRTELFEDTGINKQKSKGEFSLWVICILAIYLTTGFIHLIVQFIQNLGLDMVDLAIYQLVGGLINCLSFLIILYKKNIWGVWLFFAMMILQIPINVVRDGYIDESVIDSALIRVALLSIVLLIRKDGISAWSILLASNKSEYSANQIEEPKGEDNSIGEKADVVSTVQIGDELQLNINGQLVGAFVQQSQTSSGTIILQFNTSIEINGKKTGVIEVSPEQLQSMLLPKEDGRFITPVTEVAAKKNKMQQNNSNVIPLAIENAGIQLIEESNVSEVAPTEKPAVVDPYASFPRTKDNEIDFDKLSNEQSMLYAEQEWGREVAVKAAEGVTKALITKRKGLEKKLDKEINAVKAVKIDDDIADIDKQIAYYNEYLSYKQEVLPAESPEEVVPETAIAKLRKGSIDEVPEGISND